MALTPKPKEEALMVKGLEQVQALMVKGFEQVQAKAQMVFEGPPVLGPIGQIEGLTIRLLQPQTLALTNRLVEDMAQKVFEDLWPQQLDQLPFHAHAQEVVVVPMELC